MNKVVSIEIASQVFWIDEDAYEELKNYLLKIKQQLANEEFADDIYKDIELRIAELLFELKSGEKQAVTQEQLGKVIEQVGYIDSDNTEEVEQEVTRKSYRDPQNKILAGVCAGLATRLGVPAFIIRVVFLALAVFFGLGVALYLIFWISLDNNSSRNSALAAQGKAQTAKQIATIETPKENPLYQIQRIIFLPFSIVGTLASVIFTHFKNRRQGYILIFKNVFALVLIFFTVLICVVLFEFNGNRIFNKPVTWLLSAATMYLVVLGLVIYAREYYFSKPAIKVDKRLKLGALIPVAMFVATFGSMNYFHREHEETIVEKEFTLKGSEVTLQFNEEVEEEKLARRVAFRVKVSESNSDNVVLHLNYSSSGKTVEEAKKNIRSIDYFYTFNKNVLELNRYWTLQDKALSRGQDVEVTIEVPRNIIVNSSRAFEVRGNEKSYEYLAYQSYYDDNNEIKRYLTSGQFLHELGDNYRNKLSENERNILNEKFCDEYFISESWACDSNIRKSVTDNHRFDRAFENDNEKIEKIREYLQPDRSLFVSHLSEINQLVETLSIDYPVKGKFQEYVEHLLSTKSMDTVVTKSNSG